MLPENFVDHDVCMVGLGYVGLTLAVTMAEVGFRVAGVEVSPIALGCLAKGEPHFFEPGLDHKLKRQMERGTFSVSERIPNDLDVRVYIITVGTPLDRERRTRLDMIENAAREVREHLKAGDLIIVRSTVKLGTTRKVVAPILEEAGVPFDLAFCPERTLEGRALTELRELPQIVGGSDVAAAVRASQLFQCLTPTVVRVGDLETAEMIKLVDNSHRDVMFSYANEVARLCDEAGISVMEVIQSGKLGYGRTNLPLPGPVGGPCLEKDPHILGESFRGTGTFPEITLLCRKLNESLPAEVIDRLAKVTGVTPGFPERPVVTLLGLAFKGWPATDDLRGTMARPILEALKAKYPDATFRGYDPVVAADKVRDFGLDPCGSLKAAMAGCHVAVIANNHPVFAEMPIEDLAEMMARPGFIYDFWNNFTMRDISMPKGTGYMALGYRGRPVTAK